MTIILNVLTHLNEKFNITDGHAKNVNIQEMTLSTYCRQIID